MLDPYGFIDASPLWERVGIMMLDRLPMLLAFFAGMTVATILIPRRKAPAALVAGAFAGLIGWSMLWAVLYQFIMEPVLRGDLYYEEVQPKLQALDITGTVIHILAYAALTTAALGWRASPEPGSEPHAAHADPTHDEVRLGPGPSAPISKGLTLTLIFAPSILSLILLVPSYGILLSRDEDLVFVSLGLSCSAVLVSLVSIVNGYILHYRLWDTIQDGPARTTPGKAVGFMFIPFYNFYWLFQSFWGWTVDFNRYTQQRGIEARRAPEGMVLAACILAVVPYLNILTSPVVMVMMWIHFSRAIDGANTIRALRRGRGPTPQTTVSEAL